MPTATIPASASLSPVDFHGQTLFLVEHNGQPYTAMRPIVDGMGLDWASQFTKLKARAERWSVAIIATVAGDGKTREVMCLPLRKLPGWLMTINPAKVSPQIRERVVTYQYECDDALWDYWTKGAAVNPRAAAPARPAIVETEDGSIVPVPQGLKLEPEYDRSKASTRADRRGIFELVQDIQMTMDMMGTNISRASIYKLVAGRFGVESVEFLAKADVPTVEKFLSDFLSAISGCNYSETVETPALPAGPAKQQPALPGSIPADYAALSPADKVNVLLEAYEKTMDFAQGNAWEIERRILEIIKDANIGPGMEHMQGMQVRQMVNDLRIGFTHAMNGVNTSLNTIRPMFWMLASASKLGQRLGSCAALPPAGRRGRPRKSLPA